MIPPEAEVDLAIYPLLDGEGSRGVNEALAAVTPLKAEQDTGGPAIEELESGNRPSGLQVTTSGEVKLEPGSESPADVSSAAPREDVFEGFFEADWDNDID